MSASARGLAEPVAEFSAGIEASEQALGAIQRGADVRASAPAPGRAAGLLEHGLDRLNRSGPPAVRGGAGVGRAVADE